MGTIQLKCAGLILEFDSGLFSRKVFQYPYKVNAFRTKEKKEADIKLSFDFINRETVEKICEEALLLYSGIKNKLIYGIYEYQQGMLIVQKDEEKQIVLTVHVTANWKEITVFNDYTNTNGTFAFEYVGQLIQYAMILWKRVTLHGVLLEDQGKGIIISAPSGIGKSTHAHFWQERYRALILNGDRVVCQKKDGKWIGYGTPWCGTSGEYINRDVEIKAVVSLERGGQNSVERIGVLETFMKMHSNLIVPPWDPQMANAGFALFEEMMPEVPFYALKCRPEEASAEILKREIDKLEE